MPYKWRTAVCRIVGLLEDCELPHPTLPTKADKLEPRLFQLELHG